MALGVAVLAAAPAGAAVDSTAAVSGRGGPPGRDARKCQGQAPLGVLRACYYRGIGSARRFIGSADEAGLGSPAPTRAFAIDHQWGTGPVFDGLTPGAGGPGNDVTVVWQGRVRFTGGNYHITVLTSGEQTLTIDGRPVALERWDPQPQRRTVAVRIGPGVHQISLTWTMPAQAGQAAQLRLHWDRVPDAYPARRNTLTVDAFILTRQDLCIGGDPWTSGPQVTVSNADGSVAAAWQVDDARGLPSGWAPGDPSLEGLAQVVCLTTGYTPDQVAGIRANLDVFARTVRSWSFGGLTLDVRVHEVTGGAGPTRVGLGFWLGPWAVAPLVAADTTPRTDFVLAFGSTRDLATGRTYPTPYAGATLGADYGIGGAGYSWLPSDDPLVMVHEWEHQLTFAMHNLVGFHSLYPDRAAYPGTGYPACGQGVADTFAWFPDSEDWGVEPDSPWCGMPGEQVGIAEMHLLAHLDRSLRHYPLGYLTGNHCRDQVIDFGETGVDVGGACGGTGPTAAPTVTSVMPTGTPASAVPG